MLRRHSDACSRSHAPTSPFSSCPQQISRHCGGSEMRLRMILSILVCVLALLPALNGQSVTGQITGTVADSSGGALVGASVSLTNDISHQVRSFTTESNGSFVFTNLVPGAYSLKVSMAGFKVFEERNIIVSAQERVDLHEIHLSVVAVTCTNKVQAQ